VDILQARTGALLESGPSRVHLDSVYAVAFCSDTSLLASGDAGGTLAFWNVPSFSEHGAPIRGTGLAFRELAFSKDNTMLAAASDDGCYLWKIVNPVLPAPLTNVHTGRVKSVAFSPDGRWLASGGEDGSLQVYGKDGEPLQAEWLGKHAAGVTSVEFFPDSCRLVTGSDDQSVMLWDLTKLCGD
jgi:WD40 repeat protein